MIIVEIFFLSLQLLDFTIRFYTAQHVLFFLFQISSMVDVIVILPILIINQKQNLSTSQFINISRIFRILKVF
jgi:hypothetical protein